MLRELPEDAQLRLRYRIAYGEAAPSGDGYSSTMAGGRDFAAQIGGEPAAIEKQVLRRFGPGIHPEIVKLAVRAATEPRKPRW